MPFDILMPGFMPHAAAGDADGARLTELLPETDGVMVWALGATVVAVVVVRAVLAQAGGRN